MVKTTIEEIDGEKCWVVERGRLTCSQKKAQLISVMEMYGKADRTQNILKYIAKGRDGVIVPMPLIKTKRHGGWEEKAN